jgi:hypothetical protein
LVKSPDFTLLADQITEGNYTAWAQVYNVTGLEAPPPPVKTVSKAIDAVVPADPNESSKSQDLVIDDGFSAKYALFQRDARFYEGSSWRVLLAGPPGQQLDRRPRLPGLRGHGRRDRFGGAGVPGL